jgi:hypothetical protein
LPVVVGLLQRVRQDLVRVGRFLQGTKTHPQQQASIIILATSTAITYEEQGPRASTRARGANTKAWLSARVRGKGAKWVVR